MSFISQIITINNKKLYILTIYKLLFLIPSFELSLSNKVQSYLLVFSKTFLNLRESLASIFCNFNASLVFRILSFSDFILVKKKVTDNTIIAILPIFEKKLSGVKNKYLRCYTQILAKDLELLNKMYFRENKGMLNALIVQFCNHACVMSNHFSNLSLIV